MNLTEVESVVRNELGLDPEALGATALPGAVERRMCATGLSTAGDYSRFIAGERGEQQALANELVVPETWFFRGGRALFDTLARSIAERTNRRTAESPVRILSIPCSTGEEPYSLAIALSIQHVQPALVHIVGADISPSHMDRAKTACFSSFTFREPECDFRSSFFRQSGDRWVLDPELRNSVQFKMGNAADANFLAGESPFDLILCRNLFIYLTVEARLRVFANLDRLLAPDGWLVLSPAEADRLPSKRFIAIDRPEFGIYCRMAINDSPAITPQLVHKPTRTAVDRKVIGREAGTPRVSAMKTPTVSERSVIAPTLSVARGLADSGQLAAARMVCNELLQEKTGDASVHSLLGVVLLAEGRTTDAADTFRKALYLDADHEEALNHMIMICEVRGETAQAIAFRRRLARLAKRGAL